MTEEHKLIEQQCILLRDASIPAGLAPIQMETSRGLFYAGAVAIMRLMRVGADANGLYQELEAFKKEQRELEDPYSKTPH